MLPLLFFMKFRFPWILLEIFASYWCHDDYNSDQKAKSMEHLVEKLRSTTLAAV